MLKLDWTEEQNPNEQCSYTHVTAETPFGRFLITWKAWKHDDPTVDETPWGVFENIFCGLEEAKEECENRYFTKLEIALSAGKRQRGSD